MDIVEFAEQFLGRVGSLPAQYEKTFNAPARRTAGTSRKPAVAIVEVTLRRLHKGGASLKCRLSRTEPTVGKLRREAAAMLACAEAQAVLVKDGRVLGDGDVALATSSDTPVYVFDRQDWSRTSLPDEFRADLVRLLAKYGLPGTLADRFLSEYSNWLGE